MNLTNQNNHTRLNVLGVGISITNLYDAITTIFDWVEKSEKHYVCVTGVHGVMECQKDGKLRLIHNNSGLTVPDGMPLVWLSRSRGFSKIGRVYGPDLMLEVCERSVSKRYKHFLYGGNEGVAEKLRDNFNKMFPGINIVGIYTPPFRPLDKTEEASLINLVNQLSPDFFWVGLSTPKQEKFMAEYLPKLNTKVMLGVGAAFDILSGRIKDAPEWMKNNGLQWLFRLYKEPRRLWKRYLYNNSLFILKIAKQIVFCGNKYFRS